MTQKQVSPFFIIKRLKNEKENNKRADGVGKTNIRAMQMIMQPSPDK
ncbi:MAG: hypothetical protein MUE99_10195 [Chitinophagaceae bacterium]|nr:hypothetical protein [Chitinophagaceae bacterium]